MRNNYKAVTTLVTLIALLALIAAAMGIFWQGNSSQTHYNFKTLHDQTTSIQGYGLYRMDTVSGAAQEISQDFVTLLVGLPLLIVSLVLYRRNLLRGKLMLAGTLAYFLYTYMAMSVGTAFNVLFPVYVALFSLSLFTFIYCMLNIDVAELPYHFSNKFPRKITAGFFFFLATFLLLLWSGLVFNALITDKLPDGMESYSTLFIQVMDLGIIVPLGFITGVLLWKKSAWGYLLSSVVLFKGATMGLALCAMIIGQFLAGVEVILVGAFVFPLIALACIVLTVSLLRNISERPIIPADFQNLEKEVEQSLISGAR